MVYTLVHVVVMFALPDASASDRPLAAAAQVFLGSGGAALISIGAMLSTYGYLSGQMVSAPRLTFAFAERRDFPALFARVHPVFRTPYVSIVVYAILVWALALYGSFTWNAILSAVARLFTYGTVCGALMMLRVRRPAADAFRLPLGWLFAVLGIAFCLLLVVQMDQNHLKIVVAVLSVAALNWAVNFLLDRRRGRS